MLVKICEQAKANGVRTTYCVDERGQNIADAILSFAHRNKTNLIAMAAESGPVTSFLIGSITRQVVRHSKCPVWVLHP